MNKKTVIIITILSTILSIIFILSSYYGIDRYLSLHMKSCENFINKYSYLPKASTNRVVISFSTTPEKINKIKPMINSILDQTVKVDAIYMVLLADKNYNTPRYITNVATVVLAGKDYGGGTKIIPILLKEKECDTTIIAMNDNVVYGQDFVFTMIEELKKNPGVVLMDKKGDVMLVKPEYFGCDVINRQKEYFDNNWFLDKSKNNKIIEYNENYKII